LGQLSPHPILAFARHRQLERDFVVGIAVLIEQRLTRPLAQPRDHLRVVRLSPHLDRNAAAVGDLLLDRKVRSRQLLPAREIAVGRLALPHVATAVASHEAGAGVNQRGPLHALDEGDHVLGSLDVGAQGRFQRRVEGHLARGVDDHADVGCHRGRLLVVQAQVVLGDIAVDDANLLDQELVQTVRTAELLAQRIEGSRRHHILPEALLAGGARPPPHHHVHPADVRKAMQQHAQHHFAQEARAAQDEDVSPSVDLAWREYGIGVACRRIHRLAATPRRPSRWVAISSG
jgi:hypothetical protein